jgi:hypothetical protein
MSKARTNKARKTRPSLRVGKRPTSHPRDDEERKRSEAPTMPPPAPGEDVRQSGRVKRAPAVVTVDVVTADLSKDKRREE